MHAHTAAVARITRILFFTRSNRSAGFVITAAPPSSPLRTPPAPLSFLGGAANPSSFRSAAACCTATPAAAAATSDTPPAAAAAEVSVSVLSPREAVVELPPLDGGVGGVNGGGYSIRWFEEDNPTIFDQVRVSNMKEKTKQLDWGGG